MTDRLAVRKTYKLWIGGAFVRSESGRYDEADGLQLSRGRRARTSATRSPPRARRPGPGRRAPPTTAARSSTAPPRRSSRARRRWASPREEVDAAVDVLLHYAGWTDKLQRRARRRQPGRRAVPVVLAARADRRGRDRRARRAAAARAGGRDRAGARGRQRRAWRSCPRTHPLPGLDLAEVLGVSDVPGGVVNLLSGRRGELATALGAHRDLNAIVDAAGDAELSTELDRLAAETIKRVRHGAAAAQLRGGDRRRARAHRGGHRAQDGLAPGRRMTSG